MRIVNTEPYRYIKTKRKVEAVQKGKLNKKYKPKIKGKIKGKHIDIYAEKKRIKL